jgi:hypothetical protein
LLGTLVTAIVYEVTGGHLVPRHASPMAEAAATRPTDASNSTRRVAPAPVAPLRAARSDDIREAERLGNEVTTQRARADFAEGQLEAIEGRPIPWPKDVAPAYQEDAVTRQLKEFVVDRGLARIKNIDCSEYPCIGNLQLPDASPQAAQKLHEALNEMIKQKYTGRVALSISSSQSGEGPDRVSTASISVVPNDDDVKARVRHRIDAASP